MGSVEPGLVLVCSCVHVILQMGSSPNVEPTRQQHLQRSCPPSCFSLYKKYFKKNTQNTSTSSVILKEKPKYIFSSYKSCLLSPAPGVWLGGLKVLVSESSLGWKWSEQTKTRTWRRWKTFCLDGTRTEEFNTHRGRMADEEWVSGLVRVLGAAVSGSLRWQ